jgi:hypothetical protein
VTEVPTAASHSLGGECGCSGVIHDQAKP